jgi:choline dehydrogenase-like flavoprotein
MANLNIKSRKSQTFDVIVIGSGMSGGWAAKEFTEHGFQTLVLERGRDVKHIEDYPTAMLLPYQLEHRGELPLNVQQQSPILSRCSGFKEDNQHFFVKDAEHPYIEERPFDWIRGYHVGGRSLLWARQTQRWSQYDFEGPARDGFAVDWPIRYSDLAPWYSHVEKFAGIAGFKDGLAELPDGEFLPGFPLNAVEDHFKKTVAQKFKGRHIISGRCAHVSSPQPFHLEQGRGQCMSRTLCSRGCPLGGYYSSNSSTLPWAQKTGNLTLRPFSVVHSILYDEKTQKASGVRVIDSESKESIEYYAKVIFVNAGSMNSNLILLNSKSDRFPNGLGNDSGLLGKYLAFHNYSATISGEYEGLKEFTTDGRRPTGGYIPRFRNVFKQETDFLRGYACGFGAGRSEDRDTSSVGVSLKEGLLNPVPGNWRVGSHMMGETIPKETNYVTLDDTRVDAWGIPLLKVAVSYDDNDEKMRQDFKNELTAMFEAAGFTNIKAVDKPMSPGLDIHEMGGVRMGKDPKTSLLNAWNQMHHCKNVFVSDGACMTSTSTQNPSLTYMALTARAANHAIDELKKGNL